jgi:hypothetical protein
MDAIVTIKYRIPNICNPEDLENTGMTFQEMVQQVLEDEDMIGNRDVDGELLNVEIA